MTPEERLCSRNWRLGNSVWALTVILGTPIVGWLGFFYIAARSRIRTHIIMAVIFTVLGWGALLATVVVDTGTKESPTTGTAQSIYSAYVTLLWFVMLVAAFFANRRWLVWRAHHPRGPASVHPSSASHEQPPLTQPLAVGPLSVPNPGGYQPTVPAFRSPEEAGEDAPAARVGSGELAMNTLSQSALVDLGLSPQQASHFVATRTRLGAFSSLPEVVSSGALHPKTYAVVRERLAIQSGAAPPNAAAGGRVLEF